MRFFLFSGAGGDGVSHYGNSNRGLVFTVCVALVSGSTLTSKMDTLEKYSLARGHIWYTISLEINAKMLSVGETMGI